MVAALGALILIGSGIMAVQREVLVSRSLDRLEGQSAALRGMQTPPPRQFDLDFDAPPRALLADALFLARQGGDPRAQHRMAELTAADEAIGAALATRPHWGEAWVVRALIRAQLRGPGDPQALQALGESYILAPFLREAAEWRIGLGIAGWDRLDPQTRRSLINEAVIFAQLNGAARIRTFELARGTPAYVPLSLAWHAQSAR